MFSELSKKETNFKYALQFTKSIRSQLTDDGFRILKKIIEDSYLNQDLSKEDEMIPADESNNNSPNQPCPQILYSNRIVLEKSKCFTFFSLCTKYDQDRLPDNLENKFYQKNKTDEPAIMTTHKIKI